MTFSPPPPTRMGPTSSFLTRTCHWISSACPGRPTAPDSCATARGWRTRPMRASTRCGPPTRATSCGSPPPLPRASITATATLPTARVSCSRGYSNDNGTLFSVKPDGSGATPANSSGALGHRSRFLRSDRGGLVPRRVSCDLRRVQADRLWGIQDRALRRQRRRDRRCVGSRHPASVPSPPSGHRTASGSRSPEFAGPELWIVHPDGTGVRKIALPLLDRLDRKAFKKLKRKFLRQCKKTSSDMTQCKRKAKQRAKEKAASDRLTPVWSPDSTKLLFQRLPPRPGGAVDGECRRLRSVEADAYAWPCPIRVGDGTPWGALRPAPNNGRRLPFRTADCVLHPATSPTGTTRSSSSLAEKWVSDPKPPFPCKADSCFSSKAAIREAHAESGGAGLTGIGSTVEDGRGQSEEER